MLKKVLSSIGIGSSRVDLVLPKREFRAGEKVNGFLEISGGLTNQKINGIYIELIVTSRHEDSHITKPLDHQVIAGSLDIGAGQTVQKIPVSYTLPENIPLSAGKTRLFLTCSMDITNAVDPRDNDPITVLPCPRLDIIMRALEQELGFVHKPGSGYFNGRHQEFEYRPTRFMRGYLDELEVIFEVHRGGIGLYIELDRKARGLGGLLMEHLELDETRTSLFLDNAQITGPGAVARLIGNFLEKKY